jgi:hypothetical protein
MTRDDKITLWQERLQHQKESGIPITKWCEQQKITVSNFYYWQKKLNTPIIEEPNIMVALPLSSSTTPLTIETPSGYRILVNDTSALTMLPQLLQYLS